MIPRPNAKNFSPMNRSVQRVLTHWIGLFMVFTPNFISQVFGKDLAAFDKPFFWIAALFAIGTGIILLVDAIHFTEPIFLSYIAIPLLLLMGIFNLINRHTDSITYGLLIVSTEAVLFSTIWNFAYFFDPSKRLRKN